MERYVNNETLKRNIRVNFMPNVDVDGTVAVENAERYFLNLIDKTSTADVAEVVRCGQCKDFDARWKGTVGICNNRKCNGLRNAKDFCSYGEREEAKGDG